MLTLHVVKRCEPGELSNNMTWKAVDPNKECALFYLFFQILSWNKKWMTDPRRATVDTDFEASRLVCSN